MSASLTASVNTISRLEALNRLTSVGLINLTATVWLPMAMVSSIIFPVRLISTPKSPVNVRPDTSNTAVPVPCRAYFPSSRKITPRVPFSKLPVMPSMRLTEAEIFLPAAKIAPSDSRRLKTRSALSSARSAIFRVNSVPLIWVTPASSVVPPIL